MQTMEIEKTTRVSPIAKFLNSGHGISLIFLIWMLSFSKVPAQKIWEERTGCISGQGNLAPGYLFATKSATAYIDGDLNIFISNHISATGSLWVYFATASAMP